LLQLAFEKHCRQRDWAPVVSALVRVVGKDWLDVLVKKHVYRPSPSPRSGLLDLLIGWLAAACSRFGLGQVLGRKRQLLSVL
jgi:hypothetical protein